MTVGAQSDIIKNNINQLFSSILVEQQKIDRVKSPHDDKRNLLKSKIDLYVKNRGRNYFYNYISSGRGHGPFTELKDGSVKFDLINGIGFNLLGHSHPLMIRASLEAATVDTILCGNLQPYPEAGELSHTLLESVSNSRLEYFWFAGSGSFANDLALKLLWQKKAPNYNLIAFNNAFAGRSVATQEITDKAAYREGMPKNINVKYAPHFDHKNPETSLQTTLERLDQIWNENPNSFCAIMIELIQGEAGFVYGPHEFYKGIFDWAKKRDLYIWVDEVQTFGRTKELFAFQMLGLDDYVDIVSIAKALQTGGVLYTKDLNPKPGLIAGTFNGSISALKMGKKMIKYLLDGHFYGPEGRIAEIETLFLNKLKKLAETTCKDYISYSGGTGTMISFEVGDSTMKTTKEFIHKLFDNGVMAFTAGSNPVRVRFLLPLCLSNEHIEMIFDILERTLIKFFKK